METSKILALISENQLEEAFKRFEDFFNEIKERKSELIITQRQFNELGTQERKSIIDSKKADELKNNIANNLLDILSKIETSLDSGIEEISKKKRQVLSKSEELQLKANDAITDKGYNIIEEIYSELSYIFYKAERNDSADSNFYVVQLLNQYQLVDAETPYDEKIKSFFTKECSPFVEIQTFAAGSPCYTIRDYVDGVDLNELIEKKIKLSLLDTIKSTIIIAKGLKELHTKNIIYPNFIPSQIIMDIEGNSNILPMNIFKTNQAVVTWKQLTNAVKYMSPEQLVQSVGINGNKTLDPLCNQYSLGQVMFFMINGESIFAGDGLVELYQDRNDNKDTLSQLRTFVDTIDEKLSFYTLSDAQKDEMGTDFISAFNQLIKFDPLKRFKNISKFIIQMEFLKTRLEMAKMDSEDEDLPLVQDSFESAVAKDKNIIDTFYKNLLEEVALRDSFEIKERNILFFYSMKYLFNSISNLDHSDGLKHSLSCLVQSLHNDTEIKDFEHFFEILKNTIKENNLEDWNDRTDEAWDTFNQKVLDCIDEILTPILPQK